MPFPSQRSLRGIWPTAATAPLRWLAVVGLLGLSACATAPAVSPVPPAPAPAATVSASAPIEQPMPPDSGSASLAVTHPDPADGPASAPAAVAEAEPVLEPVHATPAERAPGAGQVLARGVASWYGQRFHGRRTASGERFNMHDLTAAHRSLPFGTRVRVRHVATGREVVVRINDRGPAVRHRIIDLSLAAARELGIQHRGTAEVQLLRE